MPHLRFLKYVFVGGTSAAIYVGLNVSLSALAGSVSMLITGFSFVVTTVINYFLHYYVTFQSAERHQKVLGRFGLLVALGALASSVVNAALVDWGVPIFWSSIIFLAMWVMISYRLAARILSP